MKRIWNQFFDKTFWLYVALGILNYGVCNLIMLILHNVFHVEKTPSLIIEFALQTGISFLLNRYVTFRGLEISRYWPVKFVVSVGLSYLFAKVLLLKVFESLIQVRPFCAISDWVQNLVARNAETPVFRENLVMLACTMTYCIINYVGQRYYVFRPRKSE